MDVSTKNDGGELGNNLAVFHLMMSRQTTNLPLRFEWVQNLPEQTFQDSTG